MHAQAIASDCLLWSLHTHVRVHRKKATMIPWCWEDSGDCREFKYSEFLQPRLLSWATRTRVNRVLRCSKSFPMFKQQPIAVLEFTKSLFVWFTIGLLDVLKSSSLFLFTKWEFEPSTKSRNLGRVEKEIHLHFRGGLYHVHRLRRNHYSSYSTLA